MGEIWTCPIIDIWNFLFSYFIGVYMPQFLNSKKESQFRGIHTSQEGTSVACIWEEKHNPLSLVSRKIHISAVQFFFNPSPKDTDSDFAMPVLWEEELSDGRGCNHPYNLRGHLHAGKGNS